MHYGDACPGALQMHHAADGALARVRLPGGVITADQLGALAQAAMRFGSEAMELTSRGNVQVRGITDAAALADAVAAAGLLPSRTHERVRNIVASPLSGRVGAHADVRRWTGALDAAIQSETALASLPGRFWFSIDDGRGDVSGLAADAGAHVLGDGVALLLAGRDTGVRMSLLQAVPTLVSVAVRFAAVRGSAWRVGELSDIRPLLKDLVGSASSGAAWPAVTRPAVGWIPQNDGRVALGAAAPLGVLQAAVAEHLAAIGAPMVITPWRSVLIFDLEEGVADAALRVLAPLGLIFDENSPWLNVSACTGTPGCEHAAADVRADAAASLTAGGPHRHYVGCERACGSPPAGEVMMATGDGYRRRRAGP
ncbi:MAG: precorrin-3B synthase [Mycobacterium sp.]|jgi:precorrin-3B synthase|nr:precorrin-3B synthase [Mycobacterium sp.]